MPGPASLPGGALLPPGAGAQRPVPDELRRVAEEFEAVFLAEMLAPMFNGLDTEGLGGGGMGEQMFRPMLIERYAQAISSAGGVGVAESVIRELMRLQEAAPIPQEAADGADR
jgi:peptidoglycan hydrolase FlgJ